MLLSYGGRRDRAYVRGNRSVGLLSLLILVFWVFSQNAWPVQTPTDDPNEKLLLMINDARTKAGLKILNHDKRIDDAAALHLGEFVKNGQISNQFEGEPSLLERVRMAQVTGGAAGEVMLQVPDLDHVPDVLKRDDIQKVLLVPSYSLAGVAQMQSGGEWFIVVNLVRALQSLSADEVEDLLVESLQEARTKAKLGRLNIVKMPQLRKSACEMAKKDSLKAEPVNPYGGRVAWYSSGPSSSVRNFTFTTLDPGSLPESLQIGRDDPRIDTASVGVCFATSKTYSGGTYWVQIVLYGGGGRQR